MKIGSEHGLAPSRKQYIAWVSGDPMANGAECFSHIGWVDYFTVLGKYIDEEKNGTVWAQEGYLHGLTISPQYKGVALQI